MGNPPATLRPRGQPGVPPAVVQPPSAEPPLPQPVPPQTSTQFPAVKAPSAPPQLTAAEEARRKDIRLTVGRLRDSSQIEINEHASRFIGKMSSHFMNFFRISMIAAGFCAMAALVAPPGVIQSLPDGGLKTALQAFVGQSPSLINRVAKLFVTFGTFRMTNLALNHFNAARPLREPELIAMRQDAINGDIEPVLDKIARMKARFLTRGIHFSKVKGLQKDTWVRLHEILEEYMQRNPDKTTEVASSMSDLEGRHKISSAAGLLTTMAATLAIGLQILPVAKHYAVKAGTGLGVLPLEPARIQRVVADWRGAFNPTSAVPAAVVEPEVPSVPAGGPPAKKPMMEHGVINWDAVPIIRKQWSDMEHVREGKEIADYILKNGVRLRIGMGGRSIEGWLQQDGENTDNVRVWFSSSKLVGSHNPIAGFTVERKSNITSVEEMQVKRN